MVGKVIRDYIEGGAKRVTVPGFGTFMRKDTGEVIFVELLRGDDGILRELIEDYGRYSEVEAMALVDRFTFETKNAIERTGSASIDGFGTMTLDGKGLYRFDYSPRPKATRESAVQEKLFAVEEGKNAGRMPRQAAPHRPEHPAPRTTGSAGANRGVSQGRDTGLHATQSRREPAAYRTAQMRRKTNTKAKMGTSAPSDLFMIIAIAAAVIAIVALAFGLSAGNMPFMMNR